MPVSKKLTIRDDEKKIEAIVNDLRLDLLPEVYAGYAANAILALAELLGARVATVSELRKHLGQFL